MNCGEFNKRLYDYVDNTLESSVRASAREHLRNCDDCRRALLREQTVAQSIRHSLDRATANLSVRPETLRNVLEVSEPKPIRPNLLIQTWQWFISSPLRPVSAGAALLGAIVLLIGLQTHHQSAENATSQAAAQARQDTWVVDVPIQTQTHVFRRQNGTVVDSIAPGLAFGHASFLQPENSKKSL